MCEIVPGRAAVANPSGGVVKLRNPGSPLGGFAPGAPADRAPGAKPPSGDPGLSALAKVIRCPHRSIDRIQDIGRRWREGRSRGRDGKQAAGHPKIIPFAL